MPGEKDNANEKCPWLMGNWIILSLLAAVCFALCNLFIGEIAPLGISGNYYYNTGSLLFSAGYFVKRACSTGEKKDFLWKNGKF